MRNRGNRKLRSRRICKKNIRRRQYEQEKEEKTSCVRKKANRTQSAVLCQIWLLQAREKLKEMQEEKNTKYIFVKYSQTQLV